MGAWVASAADVDNGLDSGMNRGQLAFLVLVNAMISLVIALAVVWVFEARRPDAEELAAINTPRPAPVLAAPVNQATATPDPAATTPATVTVATATSTPETAVETSEQVYIVQPGDTMLVIATRYDITVEDILAANNLSDPNFVFAGQRLVIPVQGGSPGTEGATSEGTAGEGTVLEPTPTATIAPDGVSISAVTSPGDVTTEQVVLVNDSGTPYSLQGWQLQRAEGDVYTFRSDVPLFPGGSIRVHSGAGTDTSIDLYWGRTEAAWQSGAEARLLTADGETVTTYVVP
jgi:LysM repeat protein